MKTTNTTRIVAGLLAVMLLLCACGQATTETGSTGATTAPNTQPSTSDTQPSESDTQPTTPDTHPSEPMGDSTEPTDPSCDHVDEDNNGICDVCFGNVTVKLDFYAFNDLHGVFMDTNSNVGVDELTTFLKNAYADDGAYEIVLSSGDMWQGSVESSSNKGALMTQWMNDLGFVSMTLGNHEYDWGSGCIADNAALADFPILGINVTDNNVDTPYCDSSVVVERGGVKIGIIGAIGDCLSSISGEYTDGITFATGNALTELVKAEAVRLREAGCDLIVYSLHEGSGNSTSGVQNVSRLDYYDMELSNGYVDLVFEAHTHQDYILQDQYGVYHLQAGGYNSGLSYVSICYNTVTDSYDVQTVDTLSPSIYADATLEDDPIVEELFDRYFPEEDPYTDVIGYNNISRDSNEIADTVAQLYLEKGRQLWGDQYDIVLGGGFLKCRTPYNLYSGKVTYSQLYSLLPFDNDLVLCQVTGRQLRTVFVHSNSANYHCAYDADLEIDDNKTYYVVTDTYTSFYKYNMFTEVERLKNYYARDLLKDYIAAENWGGSAKVVTIEQALQYGQMLGRNETSEQTFEVTGTIVSIENDYYGNLYIQDDTGYSVYVYGLNDADGVRYGNMENPPREGDTITIIGAITRYYSEYNQDGIIEFKYASMK